MKKLIIVLMAVFLVGCTPVTNTTKPPVSSTPDQTNTANISEKFKDGSIYNTPFKPLTYQLVPAYPNLTFDQPLYVTSAGDNTNRLFVVERTGKIKVFSNDSNVTSSEIFLDLSDRIVTAGSEQGLTWAGI